MNSPRPAFVSSRKPARKLIEIAIRSNVQDGGRI
jgi:hypothetical protein